MVVSRTDSLSLSSKPLTSGERPDRVVPLNGRSRVSLRAFLVPVASIGFVILLMLGGTGMYWLVTRPVPMTQKALIGDWIYSAHNKDTAIRISFERDGSCVVSYGQGIKWNGNFRLVDQDCGFFESHKMFANVDQINIEYFRAHGADEQSEVVASDGLIRFFVNGEQKNAGMNQFLRAFAGRPMIEVYVRRDGPNLKIGYVTSVQWRNKQSTVNVSWMCLEPATNHPAT